MGDMLLNQPQAMVMLGDDVHLVHLRHHPQGLSQRGGGRCGEGGDLAIEGVGSGTSGGFEDLAEALIVDGGGEVCGTETQGLIHGDADVIAPEV